MKTVEIAASFLGRQFKLLTITINKIEMKPEMVRIKIIDAYGIGYGAGHEYDVTPAEAAKLIEAGKAVAISEMPKEKETAISKKAANAEKR